MRLDIYKGYLLALLTVVLAFNFVDRVALGVVLQNIRTDLHLNDTQLGLLSGIAFALFYSVMGVPIARWADRGNRASVIALTAALWSVAVALCGAAGSFVQLLFVRVAVAVGEAGAFPPALSLISDYFSRAQRPRALAIYALASPLSGAIGYLAAGWANQLYGWRVTFVLLGIPGLVFSVVAWLTIKDPRFATSRSTLNQFAGPQVSITPAIPPSLREVCIVLWSNTTFRYLLLGCSVLFFFTYGILQWQPTFFIRSYGLTSGQVGMRLAAIYGAGGGLGAYLGGRLASQYAANNERAQLVAIAVAMVTVGGLFCVVYLSSNLNWALGLMAIAIVAQSAINGPLYATMQTLVPESMRAVSVALVMLCANLIGMGFGPLATGILSDSLRSWSAEESLRYALLILAPGYFLVAWLVWRASATVSRDVREHGGLRLNPGSINT